LGKELFKSLADEVTKRKGRCPGEHLGGRWCWRIEGQKHWKENLQNQNGWEV